MANKIKVSSIRPLLTGIIPQGTDKDFVIKKFEEVAKSGLIGKEEIEKVCKKMKDDTTDPINPKEALAIQDRLMAEIR